MSDRFTGDEMSLVRCSESALVWFYQLLIVVVVSVKWRERQGHSRHSRL